MFVLGFSGGWHRGHGAEGRTEWHDAAAVLLEDGVVVCCIEEERLSRLKHTDRFPERAIRCCLATAGLAPRDIDRWAYYFTDELTAVSLLPQTMRSVLCEQLTASLGAAIDPERLDLNNHHEAHARSAFDHSGFDESLVVVWDGAGDHESTSIWRAMSRGSLERLTDYGPSVSLGMFYLRAIRHLGYRLFDEYKVMGLAPYGDPARYRDLFSEFHALEPDGRFQLSGAHEASRVAAVLGPPRRPGGPITQDHKDFAATLQETFERLALHVLTHWRRATRQTHLCLAGGCAQNVTLNGKILTSGLFDRVFVDPAAHDAGAALGSALVSYHARAATSRSAPPRHVYWGPTIQEDTDLATWLDGWRECLTVERVESPSEAAAALLAEGCVLGWVQGASEFGPRALGNRSIIADPRPAAQKQLINEMVKKREAFRPFAPAVLEEKVHDYFIVPPSASDMSFMSFAIEVRPEMRTVLGATTHVDGTARVQTVSRRTNPKFWQLIDAFGRRTGVHVVLNTSFNNAVEPIVDSALDAVACFLTTRLHHLVIGDLLVSKRRVASWWPVLRSMRVRLPDHVQLVASNRFDPHTGRVRGFELVDLGLNRRASVSPAVYALLDRMSAGGDDLTVEAAGGADPSAATDALAAELFELWAKRLVAVMPSVEIAAPRAIVRMGIT